MTSAASLAERPACATRAGPIRVLLADDHVVAFWGLQQLVQSAQPVMTVSCTARTSEELMSQPALTQADAVLLDLTFGNISAIGNVAQLVSEIGVKVVLLTGDDNPNHHCDAAMHGARGVFFKSEPTEHILDANQRVHAGEVSLNGAQMSVLLGARPEPKSDATLRIETLTPKERQVVQADVAHRGARSLVVADELGISEDTLRNHLTVIYSKLCVHGKLNDCVFAVEHGLAGPAGGVARESLGRSADWTGVRDACGFSVRAVDPSSGRM